jgi:hypothetical protein
MQQTSTVIAAIAAATLLLVTDVLAQRTKLEADPLKTEKVEIRIDDAVIGKDGAKGRPMAVIEPLWWSVNRDDGPAAYEKSLQGFSKAQRLVFAVVVYNAEVGQDGHEAFYERVADYIWRDAVEGFEAIGLPEEAQIARETATRIGGPLSVGKDGRLPRRKLASVSLEDLNSRYYDLMLKGQNRKIMEYIRSRRGDFYFSGFVERPIAVRGLPPSSLPP